MRKFNSNPGEKGWQPGSGGMGRSEQNLRDFKGFGGLIMDWLRRGEGEGGVRKLPGV